MILNLQIRVIDKDTAQKVIDDVSANYEYLSAIVTQEADTMIPTSMKAQL